MWLLSLRNLKGRTRKILTLMKMILKVSLSLSLFMHTCCFFETNTYFVYNDEMCVLCLSCQMMKRRICLSIIWLKNPIHPHILLWELVKLNMLHIRQSFTVCLADFEGVSAIFLGLEDLVLWYYQRHNAEVFDVWYCISLKHCLI